MSTSKSLSAHDRLKGVLFEQLGLAEDTHFYVAYSGGVDSTVLLYLMRRLKETMGFSLTAMHVDHGLNPNSNRWAQHCARVCRAYDVPLQQTLLNLDDASEASARNARYDWFRARMLPGSVLLTAHHQQDRAETFLFNLLRGAGSAGLSSLRMSRRFAHSHLIRPLLDFKQSEIESIAQQRGLQWIEDPSNQQNDYSRNHIRNEILPVLNTFREDAVQNIARASANLEEENGLLREVAIADLVDVREHTLHPVDDSHALCFDDMSSLSKNRKANLLRFWLHSLNLHTPSRRLLNAVLDAFDTPPAPTAVLQEGGSQFRFYMGFLYVMPAGSEFPDFCPVDWDDPESSLQLFNSRLRVDPTPKLKDLVDKNRRARLRVVSRQNVVNPKALQGHTLNIKKWMQEAGVPPWRRQSTPLLTLEQRNSEILLAPIDQYSYNEWVCVDQS